MPVGGGAAPTNGCLVASVKLVYGRGWRGGWRKRCDICILASRVRRTLSRACCTPRVSAWPERLAAGTGEASRPLRLPLIGVLPNGPGVSWRRRAAAIRHSRPHWSAVR